MNEKIISRLCRECLSETPRSIERCGVGHGNYVFIVECADVKYVVRCSLERDAYKDTIYWLEQLAVIEIPVPKVIAKGIFEEYEYLVLSYLEGKDIGLVYLQLKDDDKKAIAREIVSIQNRVAALELENVGPDWSWYTYVEDMLERAKERIAANGYFDVEKAERLREQAKQLKSYFANVKPVAYLDDVSSKNLLIHNGRLSGIIDIDWMGIGDKLTYVALTNMALLNMEYDTDYVKYILEEMRINDIEKKAFLFYTLMYCVDFMGERGTQFMDKTIEVNEQIIDRLNGIYDRLWDEWSNENKSGA
ncbi:MAG: aminoglycoside phosphotransferase family protein [Lachnospiraceae bacterium]|nr:aminoglycoside phosphotransferase family protein [Lachnospiraceae bacterium]